MEDRERIQAAVERQRELIARIETSMDSVPEKNRDIQMFALGQLKEELAKWEEMVSEQK